jgi:methyl-accepting chemotaxis protein
MLGLSEGNLQERIDTIYQGTFGEIGKATNKSLDSLRDAFAQIEKAAHSIGEAANQLKPATQDLARRSEGQAKIAAASKAATEELAVTIKANRERLKECQTLMATLDKQAQQSHDVAIGAIASMNSIETASSEVNNIVATIEEIAFQTNLLALNASVEAARAGEAGKGFSVVASEVRALATRCSTASSQISELIGQSVEEIARGSNNVRETGSAITEMQEKLKQVLQGIEEVSEASAEQLKGVSSLDQSIEEMDEASQSNRHLAHKNSGLMEQLANLEQRLSGTLSRFLSRNVSDDPVAEEKRDAA